MKLAKVPVTSKPPLAFNACVYHSGRSEAEVN